MALRRGSTDSTRALGVLGLPKGVPSPPAATRPPAAAWRPPQRPPAPAATSPGGPGTRQCRVGCGQTPGQLPTHTPGRKPPPAGPAGWSQQGGRLRLTVASPGAGAVHASRQLPTAQPTAHSAVPCRPQLAQNRLCRLPGSARLGGPAHHKAGPGAVELRGELRRAPQHRRQLGQQLGHLPQLPRQRQKRGEQRPAAEGRRGARWGRFEQQWTPPRLPIRRETAC